jgi:F-box protein 3
VQRPEWTAAHAPPVAQSLLPGASDGDVDALAAALQLPALAPGVRLLWRLLAGQDLLFDRQAAGDFHESALHGVFGSYAVYDMCVSTRLLTLQDAVRHTRACRTHGILAAGSPCVLFAASFDLGKLFFVNTQTADVLVMTRTRQLHAAAGAGGLLAWLERYAERLAAGAYAVDEAGPGLPRCISAFSRLPGELSVAVTNGVRIEASAVWMPEVSDNARDAFAYR